MDRGPLSEESDIWQEHLWALPKGAVRGVSFYGQGTLVLSELCVFTEQIAKLEQGSEASCILKEQADANVPRPARRKERGRQNCIR